VLGLCCIVPQKLITYLQKQTIRSQKSFFLPAPPFRLIDKIKIVLDIALATVYCATKIRITFFPDLAKKKKNVNFSD